MSYDYEDFSTNFFNFQKYDLPSFQFENEQDEFNKIELDLMNNTFTQPNKSETDTIPNNNNIIQNNIIQQNINNNIQPKITNKETIATTKLLGRKKKDSGEIGKHDKTKEDNMIRKAKVLLKDNLLGFINKKIKENLKISEIIINNKRYENESIKLLNIRQKQIVDTTVDGNQKLLNTKIRDFFSDDISSIYTSQPSDFNSLLINKIYQIDYEKKVTSILDKTFLECLKYFRKDKDIDIIYDDNYKCLEGLEKGFDEIKNQLKKKNNDEEYINNFIKLIKDFDKIYFSKKARAKRVKKNAIIYN